MPDEEFAGPSRNCDNSCYCKLNDKEKCDGIYHLGGCYFNAPVAISYPHFLYASEKIQNGVLGLNPNPKQHEAGLYINRVSMFVCEKYVPQLKLRMNK